MGKTFEHYFESSVLTAQNHQALLGALQVLKVYLFSQKIITMSIKPKNIVYQRQDAQFGSIKMKRKWAKFVKLLQKDFPNNIVLQKITALL